MISQFHSILPDVSAMSDSFLHPHPHVYGVYKYFFAPRPQRSAVLLQFTPPHAHCPRPRPTTAVPIRKRTNGYLLQEPKQINANITICIVLLFYCYDYSVCI